MDSLGINQKKKKKKARDQKLWQKWRKSFMRWRKNLWAWGYPNSKLQKWKSKRTKTEKKKNKKNPEQNIKGLWDNYKSFNIQVMWIPEREEKKRTEEIFETITTGKIPKLISNTKARIQEVQRMAIRKIAPRPSKSNDSLSISFSNYRKIKD